MTFGEAAHWFVNTAGIGGILVIIVILFAAGVYTFLTRWILRGGEGEVERKSRRRIG